MEVNNTEQMQNSDMTNISVSDKQYLSDTDSGIEYDDYDNVSIQQDSPRQPTDLYFHYNSKEEKITINLLRKYQ